MNLGSIVQAQRSKTTEEKKYSIFIGAKRLIKAIRKGQINLRVKNIFLEKLEKELDRFREVVGDTWLESWIKAVYNQLGDPIEMEKIGLKQHASPYWNPTAHTLRVEALGIVKSVSQDGREVEIWQTLAPGEQIMVPWSMVAGGRNSALKGVAPQLIPLRVQRISDQHDLDIKPLTYNEWCAFCNGHEISDCCRKQILWAEYHNKLVCQRCGKCV